MRSSDGLGIIESCVTCPLRVSGYFCDFPDESLNAFEALKYSSLFPKGAILFVEGQSPRGVFMICEGRVKLMASSSEGQSLITRIAGPGELLGLSATISGNPHMATAETLAPCQINFIRREDFLRFLSEHPRACFKAAEHLSRNCYAANEQARSLGLSHTAAEKLARLILEWCARDGKASDRGIQLKITLTHEEIAQMIGSSRETVTRLLSNFKNKQLIYVKGSTFILRDRAALEAMIDGFEPAAPAQANDSRHPAACGK